MHNIKDIRQNLKNFKERLMDRNFDFKIEKFEKLDKENRKLIGEKEKLESEKKLLSKSKEQSNFEKSKKLSSQISMVANEQLIAQNKLNDFLHVIPNIALKDVPIGKDEKSNKLISQYGKTKNFEFKPKSHIELGLESHDIDFETSIKLAGSRFVAVSYTHLTLPTIA